jgi:hypothetical protein
MALKYPLANGVWSNATNWNDGTVPVSGDDVRANGFTVTIDVDINVSQIATVALAPAAAGGTFSVTTNRNITANINAGSTACLTSASGVNVTVIGNINGGFANGTYGISFTNVGSILTVTGNATAGSTTSGVQYGINSSGTVNFIGNATGSAVGFGSAAINIGVGGILNLTGIVTGGSAANTSYGVQTAGNGTYNGTIIGGSSGSSSGVRITSGVHIINSDCFAGSASASAGVSITTSTATFNGNIFGSTSSTSVGLSVSDTASNVVISTMTFSTNGGSPVNGFVKFKNTAPTITVRKANNTNQQLVDPSTTDIPVITDVRNGVVYASGALTGTLNVPIASSVAVGVPVDATVGTAIISITDMGALLASYNV